MNERTHNAPSLDPHVALLTSTILYSTLGFFIVIALFSALALWEFQRLIDWTSYFAPAFLLALFTLAYLEAIPTDIVFLLLGGSLLCNSWITLLVFSKKQPHKLEFKLSWTFLYIIASSLFIPLCLTVSSTDNPYYLLFFYISIWTNNSLNLSRRIAFWQNKTISCAIPKKIMGRVYWWSSHYFIYLL